MSVSKPIQIQLTKPPATSVTAPEESVRERYSRAAKSFEPALCCAVEYDAKLLEAIPAEVIERDYGCGDPSRYVSAGETVLDLGSGGGKICFIAAQIVGPEGQVIGVDMNDSMLELARRSQRSVAEKIGYDNVVFLKGKIQDLAINRDALNAYLKANPISGEEDFQRMEIFLQHIRNNEPMIADDSIDVVVSNCVLNLVDTQDKELLFEEIFRVLRPGGRAVISDIVSDQIVPEHLQQDPDLWSGCISGAFEEKEFLQRFGDAGFANLHIAQYDQEPWQVVESIKFRSMTVIAYKTPPVEDDEADEDQLSVMYRGPFAAIMDDQGQEYGRGLRVALPRERAESLIDGPTGEHFVLLDAEPTTDVHQHCGPGCC